MASQVPNILQNEASPDDTGIVGGRIYWACS